MNRRAARGFALQALYELEFNESAPENACKEVFMLMDEPEAGCSDFVLKLVCAVRDNLPAIDSVINGLSAGWDIQRMPVVDRNIIRLAISEMRYMEPPTPVGAAINEAVELAKTFGTDETKKFVNGLLASVAKELSECKND